jgi:hypothetical protein
MNPYGDMDDSRELDESCATQQDRHFPQTLTSGIMASIPNPHTHTAFIFKREGKRPKFGRWLECGVGRLEKDGAVNVFLDRTPVGGFSHIYLAAIGAKPPAVEPEPQRPGDDGEDSEG